MINRNRACSKPDTKKKYDKPDTKKKEDKPDTKKKDDKPDTKKKDNKPDTKKKYNKPGNKSDTSKNTIENRVSNRIKYEIQDIAKYRKVLVKMIDERINMLDLMNMQLAELTDNIEVQENVCRFNRLCHANRIVYRSQHMQSISRVYAVNMALECLRDSAGNGIWPKGITYDFIACINERNIKKYYRIAIYQKMRLIETAHQEIKMVRRLIDTNVHKYEKIIEGAGEMDIYAINQACANIDKAVGYTRKIVIMIPPIIDKKVKKVMEKNYECRKLLLERKRERNRGIRL